MIFATRAIPSVYCKKLLYRIFININQSIDINSLNESEHSNVFSGIS